MRLEQITSKLVDATRASLRADQSSGPRSTSCPISRRTARQPNRFRRGNEGVEIWRRLDPQGQILGKDYVSLSIAAPEFGPTKLYANLGRAAGADDQRSQRRDLEPRRLNKSPRAGLCAGATEIID